MRSAIDREEDLTPIHEGRIDGPGAWTPASIGGKEGLVHALAHEQLAAIDELLASTHHLAMEEITRAHFDHPALTPFLSHVGNSIMQGAGAAIIRGVDADRYSLEECERIFWGFGTHWGEAAVQSARADRIGYVRHETKDSKNRGYRSSAELVLHTDSRPIIALMSIQVAASGGYSEVASSMTVHNIIRRERPDLLAPLYEGHQYLSNELDLTPCKIPVFSNVDGVVSCMFFEPHIRKAAKKIGHMDPLMDEAVRFFREVANRENVRLHFMLERGEIMVCNNFAVLHARTEFENAPGKERLLLRLWLNTPQGRPTVPEVHYKSREFDRKYDPRYVA